jgi:ketosteroid isomerase-like protein
MASKRFIPALSVALALAACYPAAEAPALADEDTAAIREMLDTYAANVQAHDWATLVTYYTDDALRMPPDQPMYQGAAAIVAAFEALPPVTGFTLTPQVIDGRGDLAYARGTYTLDMAPPDADPVNTSGKWHAIYHRQADGSWLCVSDIWNTDVPMPM